MRDICTTFIHPAKNYPTDIKGCHANHGARHNTTPTDFDGIDHTEKKKTHIHHTDRDLLWNLQDVRLFRSYLQMKDTGTFIRKMKTTPAAGEHTGSGFSTDLLGLVVLHQQAGAEV